MSGTASIISLWKLQTPSNATSSVQTITATRCRRLAEMMRSSTGVS